VEASVDAAELARENAGRNQAGDRVSIVVADWKSIMSGNEFDLIVSNPHYLSEAEVASAQPEVREFEPHSALIAVDSGRAALEEIIRLAPAALAPGGLLALETGIDQHEYLLGVAEEAGFTNRRSVQDLSGRDRFLFLAR